jgi:hypothetical protein
MEYYFHSSIGLVSITPRAALPTSVELRINGEFWSFYLSAEDAANAVAASTTGHEELDALASWSVPALLSCWSQSVPHHFPSDTPQASAEAEHSEAASKLETNLAI